MKITVIGLGYVGSAVAVQFAKKNIVYAYDTNETKISKLKNGQSPVKDKLIEETLKETVSFFPTSNFSEAVKDSEFIYFALPTNFNEKTEEFDLEALETSIIKAHKENPFAILVIKSTIPINFTRKMRNLLRYDGIVFAPEFSREGKSLYDCIHPSRIIFSATKDKSITDRLIALTKENILSEPPIKVINCEEAEAVKLFSNTYLALRVAFFNELDTICQTLGLDSKSIIDSTCLDERIGNFYNNPSFGFGGYCLPKDTKKIESLIKKNNIQASLLLGINKSNEYRKNFISSQILAKNPKVVGIYSLAMKIGSDNHRESSIIDVILNLKKEDIEIVLFDPYVKENEFGLKQESNLEKFKNECDIILTNRMQKVLLDVKDKVYTRDIYNRD